LKILNRFLIEKMAFGRHAYGTRGAFPALPDVSLGTFQENIGKRTRRIAEVQGRVT
jgi:hypothetical protein